MLIKVKSTNPSGYMLVEPSDFDKGNYEKFEDEPKSNKGDACGVKSGEVKSDNTQEVVKSDDTQKEVKSDDTQKEVKSSIPNFGLKSKKNK